MKKRIFLFTFIIALVIAMTACAASSADTDAEYKFDYKPIFSDECDADMKIDGILDEERWQGKNVFSHVSRGVEVRTVATLTEKGVYIAAVAYDNEITWYGRLDMKHNSCFRIYVALDSADKARPFDALRFDVDSKNIRSYNQARFTGASTVVGEVNSGNTFCLTAEVFVSWKALGCDGETVPDRVKVDPVYNIVRKASGGKTESTRVYPFLTVDTYMYSYLEFDRDGYVSDGEDEVLGNAENGMCRSDGWDLTEASKGKVTSIKRGQQALFFKGVNSENFYAKATVRPIAAINDSNPQVGLVTVSDFISYRALFVNVNSYLSGSINARLMTPYPTEYGWNESSVITARKLDASEKEDGLQVEIVKVGNHILYFIENRFVYEEFLGYLDGNACPALYALGCKAEFTEYEAGALTSEQAAKYLNERKNVHVVTVEETGGGSLTPERYAVVGGESLTVNISPDAGYYLTDFTINGKSLYDSVKRGLNEGKFDIPAEEIAKDVSLGASFKYVAPRGSERKTVNISVTSDIPYEGFEIAGANVDIMDEENPMLRYSITSAGETISLRTLPIAGTVLTEGVIASGKYVVTVTAQGYLPKSGKITLDSSTASVTQATFKLSSHVVGGVAKAGESVYVSEYNENRGNWVMDDTNPDGSTKPLDEVKLTAYSGSSNTAMYFAGKAGRKAIIEFTVENLCDGVEYTEAAPGVGVIISNRATEIEAIVFNDLVRVMPDRMWLIDGNQEYRNGAGYNFSRYGARLRIRVVHDGKKLSMYADTAPDDGTEDFIEVYSGINEDLDLPAAYAITVTQTAKTKVEFTDFRFTGESDPTISDKIKEINYGKITLDNRTDATVSVIGADDDGYAAKNEKATFSVSDNPGIVTLTLGGKKYVVRGNGSFDYLVTGSENVIVETMENAYSVTGLLNVGANAAGLNVRLEDTTISAVSGGTGYAFVGAVKGSGEYAIWLPSGEYAVSFDNENLMSTTKTIAVGADASGENATFVYPRPVSSVVVGDKTVSGSKKAWTETDNGYVSAVASREVKYFSGSAAAYSIEATLDALGPENSPMAGIEIADGTTSYLYMILETPTAKELYFIRKSDWKVMRIGTFGYSAGKITLKAVCDGQSIALYAGEELKAEIRPETAVMSGNADFIGAECSLGLISNSHATVFSEIRISLTN